MGMFFTGGIEKYLYYIDKYGSHDKFQYYLLYIGNKNEYEKTIYNIKNILMISYEWNHLYLNNLLSLIKPDLIIDHYSLYLEKNRDIYENITKNIIYFVHSAILYNNNISNLNINKCIHLYDEPNKENSWLEIENNYYITLGTEKRIEIERYLDIDIKKIRIEKSLENETLYLEDEKEKELEIENETLLETEKFIEIENKINSKRNSYFKKSKNNKFKKNKIFISIIGRIAEEKIPIIFLEKLVILAKNIFNYIEIHIYGEKDYTFNKEYINNFNNIILNSKIKVHDFIHPDNLKDVFLKTNFLLIPSIYETGSFTCLEAFSYGIPVIARNVYGLKFLIEDNITGFLGDSDEEILSIINNIKNNTILENRNLIIEKSLKYDIVEKINDLEFIIEEECNPKNLVIITSVLNICDKPLSYYDIRSVFNIEERVKQTIKTIKSLKQFIPNLEILFCECSNIDIETEELIKSNVNYFYNFNNNQEIKEKVDSKYKGWGEAVILLEGMKYIKKYYYKNIFKISGRYYLNNLFDYQKFNNSYNIFSLWDNSNKSLCTIFYKINMYSLEIFKEKLFNSLPFLETGNSIEWIIYNFFSDHIIIFDKLNISGYLSTEGYLFSV
jgi:glycosyltransferase involved in cell wall biosynthesis